jgi:hypothetical protein
MKQFLSMLAIGLIAGSISVSAMAADAAKLEVKPAVKAAANKTAAVKKDTSLKAAVKKHTAIEKKAAIK